MNKLHNAINEIKKIECPTGNLEQRISGILVDYNLTNKDAKVVRDNNLDTNGAEAFKAHINNGTLVIIAASGMDDYVAKVINVYEIGE